MGYPLQLRGLIQSQPMSGVYAIEVTLGQSEEITFGAAGDRALEAGRYVYVGSAPNTSFARVDRHREVAEGTRDTRHWHIDYLLSSSYTELTDTWTATEEEECSLAKRLGRNSTVSEVGDLGASDCECNTHLFVLDEGRRLQDVV